MTFIESFLPAFAANVASFMVQKAGSKTAAKFAASGLQTSIENCVHHGTTALLSKAAAPTQDDLHKLTDCFEDFFQKDPVTRELAKLLRGKEPDPEELVLMFDEEADWNLEKMPAIDFDAGIRAFIAAFMETALGEPRLNEIIRAENLIRQTELQEALLLEMRQLVAFLRKDGPRVVGINADTIEARNVANQIVIHQLAPIDIHQQRAQTEEGHYLSTLIGQCDPVDLAAIDEMCGADDTVRISDVFTALNLVGPGRLPDESIADVILSGTAARRDPQKKSEREPVPIGAIEAVGALERLVILGQPGGGKSTLVNYITTQLALRRSDPSRRLDPLPGWPPDETPLPVRIILRQLANDMPDDNSRDGAGTVWEHIRKQLAKDGCDGFYEPLRRILQETGGVICFDGLDEVMQSDEDPRRQRIKDVVEAFSRPLKGKCKIIVTSREYAYHKSDQWRLHPDLFPEVVLAGFNPDQVKEFIQTWYSVIGPKKELNEEEIQNHANHLIDAVQSLPHLEELARYPLLLTLMAQVHGTIGTLPQNRADLYERAVNLLLAHWDNRLVREVGGACRVEKGLLVMRLKVPLETLRASLEKIAFKAHQKQETAENRSSGCVDIPMMDLLLELEKELGSYDKGKAVVEYIHERAGLLQALEEYKVYAFPHRTFQEYLAAAYIMKKSDFNTRLSKRIRRDLVWWREVYLLAAGLSRKFPVYVSSLVTTLLPQDPKPSGKIPVQKSRLALLAGNALVETKFSEHAASEKQEEQEEPGIYTTTYKRVQNWLVQSLCSAKTLDAKARVESGRVLARLGDPRLEVTTLDQMAFCRVPGGPFQMGSDEYDDEKPPHENKCLKYDYWISQYPVTNSQYAEFVDTGGYEMDQYWQEAKSAGCWKAGLFKGEFEDEFRKGPESYRTPFDLSNHPVVGVSWFEALAFTRWLTDVWQERGVIPAGWSVRLPSEAEWEKAARGGLEIPKPAVISKALEKDWNREGTHVDNELPHRTYPWGVKKSKEKANYNDTRIGTTSAVGCFPSGASPYGCLDMSGNVWEWTRSIHADYPYDPGDGLEDEKPNEIRVLRGGAFPNTADFVRCANRDRNLPSYRLRYLGFRCCVCAP